MPGIPKSNFAVAGLALCGLVLAVACDGGTEAGSDPAVVATGTGVSAALPTESQNEPFDPEAFGVAVPRLSAETARAALRPYKIGDNEPGLHIGSVAPRLPVQGWLQGDPIKPAEGTAYVVELWATWCRPCIEAMPHLSDLAERHADDGVVVIAINVEESDLDTVRGFIEEHSADMLYSIGYDRSEAAQNQWVEAAGLRGLPASFVIGRDQQIAWVGHPSALEPVVTAVAKNRWSPEEGRRRARDQRLAIPYSERAVTLLATDPDAAYPLIRTLLRSVLHEQPEYLHGLAYHVFAAPNVARRDLDVAYDVAARASELLEWNDPAVLETLSKIREKQGRNEDARALQRRAVKTSGGAARYRSRLERL